MSAAGGGRRGQTDLEPIIARLQDIATRCESFGSSTDELEQLQRRLDLILGALRSGRGPRGGPVDFAELERMLAPVGRVFKNLGHHRMAREIEYVDQVLDELAASQPDLQQPARSSQANPTAAEPAPARRASPRSQSEVENRIVAVLLLPSAACGIAITWLVVDRGFAPHPALTTVISLLAGFISGGLVAMAGASAILGWRAGGTRRQAAGVIAVLLLVPWHVGGLYCAWLDMRQLTQSEQPGAEAVVAVVHPPLPSPTPTARPTPQPVWQRPVPTRGPSLINLPTRVEKARSALAAENVDAAIKHLNDAARISVDHPTVVEVARQVVDFLVDRAAVEARLTHWQRAREALDRARDTGQRFGLPLDRLDRERKDLEELIHSHRLRPGDEAAIRSSVGREAIIVHHDGSTERGTLRGVQEGTLLLDEVDDVGAGKVFFKHTIPLETIEVVNVVPK